MQCRERLRISGKCSLSWKHNKDFYALRVDWSLTHGGHAHLLPNLMVET